MRRYFKYGLEELQHKFSAEKFGSSSVRKFSSKQPRARNLTFAFLLSLIFHSVFFIAFKFVAPYSPLAKEKTLTLNFVDKEKKAEEKKVPNKNKPVVTTAPSKDQSRPKDAKFLAVYNQSTEKETRSKITSLSPENISKRPQKKGRPDTTQNKPQEKEVSAPKPQEALAKNDLKESDEGEIKASVDDFVKEAKDTKDPLGLFSGIQGNAAVDAMPFADRLEDIEEGDQTQLNTWQWRHAPFFNRMKSQIGNVWSPHAQISRFDPQGELLGQKDRVTTVTVTIDDLGNLIDLVISGASGVAYLDEEAERTFRAAAPFPYPPKELFEGEKLFSFNFSFHLQVQRGLSFQFDWEK